MNGKRAKRLRRAVAGDPDMVGRVFCRQELGKDGHIKPSEATYLLHPTSYRAQYQQAKKEAAWRK